MNASTRLSIFAAAVALFAGCARAEKPADAGLPFRKVFGPEAPGPYKHPAAIDELANGDLYIAYYGGEGEYARDTKVYGSRAPKGTDDWSPPETIADTPFVSEGNPVVWQAPDGLVWLFYVVRYGDTWSTSRIAAKISRDGARTWSDSMIVAFEEGWMVRGKPIVLRNGDYLLPCYYETGHDTEMVGPDTCSTFLRWPAGGDRWVESGRILSDKGNLQPAPAQIDDDLVVAYCRRGGNYEPTTDGWIVRGESTDGGRTWSRGENTDFPNPNAAIDLLRLKNGNLLLIYNDSMNERSPLTGALSTDGGKTWPHRRNIATGPHDYAYPYAIQGADGRIHLIFTSEERTQINHAVLSEEDFTGGRK